MIEFKTRNDRKRYDMALQVTTQEMMAGHTTICDSLPSL